jgi:hypothetical protein
MQHAPLIQLNVMPACKTPRTACAMLLSVLRKIKGVALLSE